MNFKGLKVLVLDGFGRQVPSMLQQLNELGCVITTVNSSKFDPGYSSKYPARKIVCKGIKDDKWLMREVVEREIMSGNYDVVFPVTDATTDYVTSNQERYSKRIRIAAAPRGAFIKAYDKESTLKAAKEAAVPCPLTRMDDETIDEYLTKAELPLALKPRKGTGSVGFCRVETREDLLRIIDEGIIKPEEYVIQEFIPQGGTRYANNIFIDKEGNVKSSVVVQTVRWFPVDGGAGCFTKSCNHPEIEEYSKKLLKKIDWSGFCAVSYIVDPRDNTPKLLEINGRIPAGVKICHLCGINVMKQMIEAAYEEDVTRFRANIRGGIAIRYFHTDILWLLKSPNRFKTTPLWFDFRNCRDYIFSWSDPLPFFTYALRGIGSYKHEMKKRDRNPAKSLE